LTGLLGLLTSWVAKLIFEVRILHEYDNKKWNILSRKISITRVYCLLLLSFCFHFIFRVCDKKLRLEKWRNQTPTNVNTIFSSVGSREFYSLQMYQKINLVSIRVHRLLLLSLLLLSLLFFQLQGGSTLKKNHISLIWFLDPLPSWSTYEAYACAVGWRKNHKRGNLVNIFANFLIAGKGQLFIGVWSSLISNFILDRSEFR
jgi:hypothetical protein